MKKMNLRAAALLLLVSGAALSTGCDNSDDNGNPGSNKYTLTVTLSVPSGYETTEMPEMSVTATNSDKDLTYTETLAAGGSSVTFEVSSGQYQVTATGQFSNTITFTGATAADVFADKAVTIALAEVNESPLLFKEIYTTSYNYVMNDTYMEIVNNSDEVQYLDQVIIGAMISLSQPNPWVDDQGQVLDRYPLYGVVAAFPGSGQEFPLQPGKSVVIANDATNWANAADLSGANWECYVSNAVQEDVDYDAPNLDVIYNNQSQRRLGTGFFGGGLVMGKLPAGMTPAEFAAEASNAMTMPNSSGSMLYLMLPSKYLLDAVEIFDASGTTTHYHTLLAQDDSGSALVTGWSGKSIRRKVTRVENGRAYYQDTNNSTNDFLTDQPLTPGVHPSQAD